jgi:deoxyribose-phosphate aldolase
MLNSEQVFTPQQIAKYIDHTLLKPDATANDIEQLCREAIQCGFYSVCVNSSRVALARYLLEDTDVKVCSVVGFPLGAMDGDAKRYETEVAIDEGAHEIDVVINIGLLKDKEDKKILRELRDIVEAADERIVKVIIETCLLNDEEKIRACNLILESEAHFVKTSTGFSTSGATIEDVKLLRQIVGEKLGVKAAGGIRDAATAIAMIKAGANRLGTSNGVKIVQGLTAPPNSLTSY